MSIDLVKLLKRQLEQVFKGKYGLKLLLTVLDTTYE